MLEHVDDIFERVLDETLLIIPEHLRVKIQNIAFLLEDEPSDEVRMHEDLGDDETLLGYYQGVPQTARGGQYGEGALPMPDTITLFRFPIMDAAEEDGLSIEQVIRETILHEVAHYFGMSENDVHAWERDGRKPRVQ